MLLGELRKRTRACHDELEKSPVLMRLVNPTKLTDYTDVLKGFYGFYVPFEELYQIEKPGLDSFFSQKSHLIAHDLASFGLDISTLKLCNCMPKMDCKGHWLGMLYTMEGSAHGRKFLWPKIQKALDLEKGNTFFTDQAEGLEKHWQKFCQKLEEHDLSEKEEVIEGSIRTFQSLKQWLDTL